MFEKKKLRKGDSLSSVSSVFIKTRKSKHNEYLRALFTLPDYHHPTSTAQHFNLIVCVWMRFVQIS